ncbi:MAG: hypothetical protein LPK26_13865 [Bacillaceae bacterium]|nr:hypothetical protein [Bacillaceae bacterium]
MFLYLIFILLLISFACFKQGRNERKGLRLTLSITLAIMLPFILEGTAHSLVEAQVIEGTPLILLFFMLPIVFFTSFQLLFYEIGNMSKGERP